MFETILLAISSVLWYLCLVDPNAKLTENDRVYHEPSYSLFIALAAPTKYLMALYSIAEIYAGSNGFYFTDLESLSAGRSADARGAARNNIGSVRFLGLILFILGGSLRLWAMRTLGSLFTFNLSIRTSHTLIRTGPYGWVRNPSYTGIYFMVLGLHIVGNTGNIPRYLFLVGAKIGIQLSTPWLLLGSAISFMFSHYLLRIRIINEERMLEGEFREEWKLYKKDTPYRIFPWIW